MKTKSLLTAGALAMLMAACSNEELVVDNEQLSADRPVVGDLVVNTVFGGDEGSRATFEGTRWIFEDGDKFGAYLMDTWTGAPATGLGAYTFIDYIHTNYPFQKAGEVWSSVAGAPVCEGNYFFAYPFDETITNRGKVFYSVDHKQRAYYSGYETSASKELGAYDPWNTWAENQQYLGYSFVEATNSDVNNLTVYFDPIFANPRFKILNASYSELKVSKMLIRAKEGQGPRAKEGQGCEWYKLPTKVQLDPTNFEADTYRNVIGDAVPRIQALQTALVDQEDAYVYEYVVDFGENYTVPVGKYIEAVAIMPAGSYPELDVYLFVETTTNGNKGIIRIKDTERPQWNGKTQAGSMQLEMKAGVTQRFTATIETNSIGNIGMEGFTVVNSDDLEYVIDLMAKDGGIHKLKITTWGDQVELTQSIYEKLTKFNEGEDAPELGGIMLYIDGTIVIPEGVDANAINRLSTDCDFANTVIVNKGVQVLNKNVDAEVINYGTITEAENVDVTISHDVEVKAGRVAVTTIEGDVNVCAGASLVATSIEGDLVNAGTADVETIGGDASNEGTLTINNVKKTLTNEGTVVAEGGNLNKFLNEKTGSISIEGNVSTNKESVNDGNLSVVADAELSGANVKNNGTIANNGTIYAALINETGVINNYATLKNVVNRSEVNAHAGVISKIKNGVNGKLFVWDEDVDITIDSESKGTTIFEGVAAQHVKGTNNENETFVYRAYAAMKYSELSAIYDVTEFDQLWTSYDVTFDTVFTLDGFNMIKVYGNAVTFTGDASLKNIALEVSSVLNIMNNSTIRVKSYELKNGEIHIATGSKLLVGNGLFPTSYEGHQILK